MTDDEIPQAGDLIWTDFDPTVGREQAGRRPAVVISPAAFYVATRFAIVCPIISRIRPFPTSVVLPEGLPIQGEVLTSHVRSIDTAPRRIRRIGQAVPAGILAEIRAKLAVLTGMAGAT
ncbi:MAG: type II toxin-antitoxin system PemK/MazF family toxin [Alphaproteobacteria bacterium]